MEIPRFYYHFIIMILTILLNAGCSYTHWQRTLSDGSGHIPKKLKTWKEIRDQNVVIQGFDYSCGAAAMATLMKFYFQEDVTEKEILNEILKRMSPKETDDRQRKGLSLLDLLMCAKKRGYQAVGVKLSFKALPDLAGPVIVYIKKDGYQHFAVLRGIREDRVYLADPSRGNIRMPVDVFARQWSGVALVLGKEGFSLPSEHPLLVKEEPPIRHELGAARRALFISP